MNARWVAVSLFVGAVGIACSVTPHPGGGPGSANVPSFPAPFNPSVPLCPNASGVAPLGTLYRQDAVPIGLACEGASTCSISVHDCANDWPTCGDAHVGVYGCVCDAGRWQCGRTAEGGVACPSGGSIPLNACCDPAGPNLCERALSDCSTSCDPDLHVCLSSGATCPVPLTDGGASSEAGPGAADASGRDAGSDGGCGTSPGCQAGEVCAAGRCESGCYSDAECSAGARCNASTACLSPPGCDIANGGCPTVCYGYCVP